MTETLTTPAPDGAGPDRHDDPPPIPPAPAGVPHAGLRLAGLAAVLVLVGITWPWMLVTILAIALLITLHELGHFVMAKRAGMKVTEAFLGFGPRLWSVHRGETEYGIKLIPAGAYVKVIGMSNLDEVPPEDEARTYRQKSFWQRIGVAVAGSTMHFILALVLIFIALVGIGQPMGTVDPQAIARNWEVGKVVPGSAADEAGLREGDRLLTIDGESVQPFDDLKPQVTALKGESVALTYERDGRTRTTELTPHSFRQWYVGEVAPGSGPAKAGLQPDDLILSIDGATPAGKDYFTEVVAPLDGKTVEVAYLRGDERRTAQVEVRGLDLLSVDGCCLGVGDQSPAVERLNPIEGLIATPQEFWTIARLSLGGLGSFFSPSGIKGFAGQVSDAREDRDAAEHPLEEAKTTTSPGGGSTWTKATPNQVASAGRGENRMLSIVGLVQVGSSAGAADPAQLILIFALVNIGIGLINLTPLLPFDGGHVAIAVYERIQEKRLGQRRYFTDVARLLPLTYGVVAVLAMLFISTIYLDLANPLVGR